MVSRWWKRTRGRVQRWLNLTLCLALLVSASPVAPAAASMGARAPRPAATDSGASAANAPPHAEPIRQAEDPPRNQGVLLGRVVDATTSAQLAGVQVVAVGVLDPFPLPLYLPLLMASDGLGGSGKTAAPPPNGRPAGRPFVISPLFETVTFTTTSDALGDFIFAVPAGDYTLTFTLAGYTPDERVRPVRANEVLRLDDMRMHPQDPVVTELDSGGGMAVNSLGNSSVDFPAGALAEDAEVRVTYVGNEDLPDFFPDGSAPMGFSAFEPAGAVFPAGKEVLWTVEYTGTLPVGTDTLCYWWDGKEQRWRDPVPGKVVDMGNGAKALQARVPHFSFYGHALPGVAGQRPGQAGDPTVTTANAGEGRDQFT